MKKEAKEILEEIGKICSKISKFELDEKVEILNEIRKSLHEISPFSEPVDCVQWVKSEKVEANEYNPNRVAPPEMKLLALSINNDGYTQPIVSFHDEINKRYIVVDGFHRNRVGKENPEIKERIHNYLPITVIDKDLPERMASTIRHNRARGTHGIAPMSKLVEELYFLGWSDKRIGEQLGMQKDEVLRLKQFTGLGVLFKDREFSNAWE